ncbi:DUF3618 domain-containing protein [Streptomyces sp. NPDC053367]|uniref:DUF3618 domain-containing protein n=1 Tax=Streptomyces sp. NPDC053367 TaxID=3365700 RepID=UPI0037D2B628
MGTAPDQLRSEIDSTRNRLAKNVDQLTEHARPRQMVRRRTRRMRGAMSGLRDRVMGSAAESAQSTRDRTAQAGQSIQENAGSAADSVRQAAGQVGNAVSRAPEQAVQQTQGSPLAAGLIAFGAGLLTASLLPTSQAEERAASRMTEQVGDALEPAKQAALESAQQLKQDATHVAQQAAQEVKDTATQAAKTTQEEAAEQAGQVGQQARTSGQQVADEARGQN